MASNHTPTPWKLDQYGSVFDARGEIVSANGFATICSPGDRMDESKSNSALIVAAVNSYEANKARIAELEAALRQADSIFTQLILEMRAGFGSSFGETREQVRRAQAKTRAILESSNGG